MYASSNFCSSKISPGLDLFEHIHSGLVHVHFHCKLTSSQINLSILWRLSDCFVCRLACFRLTGLIVSSENLFTLCHQWRLKSTRKVPLAWISRQESVWGAGLGVGEGPASRGVRVSDDVLRKPQPEGQVLPTLGLWARSQGHAFVPISGYFGATMEE